MGSYGIGPGRVLAAAVEQHGSDEGMVWPAEIAPYDVHVVVLGWDNSELVRIGEEMAASLSAEGLDVLPAIGRHVLWHGAQPLSK